MLAIDWSPSQTVPCGISTVSEHTQTDPTHLSWSDDSFFAVYQIPIFFWDTLPAIWVTKHNEKITETWSRLAHQELDVHFLPTFSTEMPGWGIPVISRKVSIKKPPKYGKATVPKAVYKKLGVSHDAVASLLFLGLGTTWRHQGACWCITQKLYKLSLRKPCNQSEKTWREMYIFVPGQDWAFATHCLPSNEMQDL